MIKTKIIEINDYNYIVKDNNNKKYNMNLEFYHLDNDLNIGDVIYFPSKLLVDYAVYTFGPINESVNSEKIEEFIKVIIDDTEIYLQRYYG